MYFGIHNIGMHNIKIVGDFLAGIGINSIKRNGQVVFYQNHFCTQNLTTIKETIESLIKLELNQTIDNP